MPTPNLEDVINGATPLENELAEVHPRLHLNPARLAQLRQRRGEQPWAAMLASVRQIADGGVAQIKANQTEGRGGPGGKLPHIALTFLMTGEKTYLDAARDIMRATMLYEGPDGHGSFGGCWLFALGIAYDWLYHDLDKQTLTDTRAYIARRGRETYEHIARYETIAGSWFSCNHLPNYLYDLAAGGLAIYNDEPNMAPWLRLVLEKTRQMIHSLGPDGASQEGICYGEFYTEYFVKSVDLVCDLLGVDFFTQSEWLKNVWAFQVYSSLPRSSWGASGCLMCFGDGVRYHWHGPDNYLFRMASYHRNGHAQWMALESFGANNTGGEGRYLNPIWYDPSVKPTPPTNLPTLHHFEDHGMVFMRSAWNSRENVMGFRAAPFSGHHAMRNYNSDIGGGHMHPDAGSFLLFARGEWMIRDAGYSEKMTAYRNTITINGIGQTGEKSVWFEGVELRRKPRAARIVSVTNEPEWDSVTADLTQAYEPAAGATRILRHMVYLKPDCWLIVDQVAAAAPSTFDLHFHTEHAIQMLGDRACRADGQQASLTITSLQADDARLVSEKQTIRGIASHQHEALNLLRIANPAPRREATFITLMEAHESRQPARAQAIVGAGNSNAVTVDVTVDQGRKFRVSFNGAGELTVAR